MATAEIALLVAAVLSLLVAAALAAAETAVSRLSMASIEELRHDGGRGADKLQALVQDRPRYVNALLFSHHVLLLLAMALVLLAVLRQWPGSPALDTGLAVAAMSVLSFVIVGVGARTLGKQHSMAIARGLSRPIRGLAVVVSPITKLLILLGNAVTPGKGFPAGPFASQAELREMVDAAEAADLIEDDERQMIHSVFELGDTIAREVMVPRTEMVYLERDRTLRQGLSLGLRSGFSRIPVVGENVDDVLGVVYIKDIARRTFEHRDAETTERVDSIMRPAYFVPDSKNVDELLRQMQVERVHLAVVVDEFGGTAGLVTIEDILEEIVGEIADEYDTGGPEVVALPGGGWRISARLHVDDLAELVGIDLDGEAEGVETVSGLLARRLGKVPIPGATVVEQGWELTAESAAGRRHRIGTVLCRQVPGDDADADDERETADA
jgi:CBS domain containing-hemolysin-like protein